MNANSQYTAQINEILQRTSMRETFDALYTLYDCCTGKAAFVYALIWVLVYNQRREK